MHSDGGTHFCNQVIKHLTEKRGWKHTVCTPHSKWANGVAERNIRTMKDILVQLCRDLDVPQNKWPTILPLVQGAMNRKKRASRGNMSPIELTTGIQPRTVAEMIYRGGKVVDVIDEKASLTLNEAVRRMISVMEEKYDAQSQHGQESEERKEP